VIAAVQTLDELFRTTAARFPTATALEVGPYILTYEQLDHVVQRLADRIRADAGPRPRRIGLLASRSLLSCAGFLAVLRCGAAVVPIGPAYPLPRIRDIVARTGVDAVLVPDEQSAAGVDARRLPCPDAELVAQGVAGEPEPHRPAVRTADHAYLMFTSGSTGRPRGVPISHAQALAMVDGSVRDFGFTRHDRGALTSDLTFDPSVEQMFAMWAVGATVVVPQAGEVVRPRRFITDRAVSYWFAVPSVLSLAIRTGDLPAGSLPTLRTLVMGGEKVTAAQAAQAARIAPSARLFNAYGPTELTVMTTRWRINPNGRLLASARNGSMPLGPVTEHLEWVVLDDQGQAATVGELYARGSQRFDGYLDADDNVGRFVTWEPGATARRYVAGEPLTDQHWYATGDRVSVDDGMLVFLGRADDQVKIRGQRVELGEVEGALARHPAVTEAAVVAWDGDLGPQLAAFHTGADVPAGELVAHLRALLPVHMVPSSFHHSAGLPLNGNGKVDRRRLAALAGAHGKGA
jgi:amino acid adenylation domain-containing protein